MKQPRHRQITFTGLNDPSSPNFYNRLNDCIQDLTRSFKESGWDVGIKTSLHKPLIFGITYAYGALTVPCELLQDHARIEQYLSIIESTLMRYPDLAPYVITSYKKGD